MTSLRLLAPLLALLCALAGCARGPEPRVVRATRAAAPVAAPDPSAGPEAVEVLRGWDAARARAWARGDPRALARLYVPGSRAGRRDVAMLREWLAQGLRLRDLQTQLLSVREVARTRTTWTLVVTDRLVGGVVTGRRSGGALPRDGPTTRTVLLRRLEGSWRVAAVRLGEVTASPVRADPSAPP